MDKKMRKNAVIARELAEMAKRLVASDASGRLFQARPESKRKTAETLEQARERFAAALRMEGASIFHGLDSGSPVKGTAFIKCSDAIAIGKPAADVFQWSGMGLDSGAELDISFYADGERLRIITNIKYKSVDGSLHITDIGGSADHFDLYPVRIPGSPEYLPDQIRFKDENEAKRALEWLKGEGLAAQFSSIAGQWIDKASRTLMDSMEMQYDQIVESDEWKEYKKTAHGKIESTGV